MHTVFICLLTLLWFFLSACPHRYDFVICKIEDPNVSCISSANFQNKSILLTDIELHCTVTKSLSVALIPHTLITARKRSCGKVMFLHLSVSQSVHSGGKVYAPPGRHPLGRDILPRGRHPRDCILVLFDRSITDKFVLRLNLESPFISGSQF